VDRALDALTEGAHGGANLLALSIEAARAQATVGEISLAIEKAFGRHCAKAAAVAGVYAQEAGQDSPAILRVRDLVRAFLENEGRPPRILVAKIGQDGHDRGQMVIASALGDLGFEVEIGPLFATPAEVAQQAVEKNVHMVGVSSLAGGHLTLVPQLRAALSRAGGSRIVVVVGGIIPREDCNALSEAGAAVIFGPGTSITQAAASLIELLNDRLGYRQSG
jgi:methylmalonyl-CoA mutase